MAKIKAKLVIEVVYDDGGYDDFDPNYVLHSFAEYGVNNGMLTGEEGPITVDTYTIKVYTEDCDE